MMPSREQNQSGSAKGPHAPRRDELVDALTRFDRQLRDRDIWYCLAFGTLLGGVRDGNLIEWDHDIDLIARPTDLLKLLALNGSTDRHGLRVRALRAQGASLALNPGRVLSFDPGFLMLEADGISVGEIYLPSIFADGVLRQYDFATEVAYWPETSFPHFFVSRLATAEVDGSPYPIPQFSARLLKAWYGTDWRVPYRGQLDGGEERNDRSRHGTVNAPTLSETVAWCERRGWNRSRYRDEPAWPRRIAGAGPREPGPRTRHSSGSQWWHTLDELVRYY